MAIAIFGFEFTHAPEKLQGFDRKNTFVEKGSRKAATATNKQFGAIGIEEIFVDKKNILILKKYRFQNQKT
jgi:hypothetical protein